MRMELNWPMEPLMCLGVISPKYMGSTLRAIPVSRRKALNEGCHRAASENSLALWNNRRAIVFKSASFYILLSAERMEQMSTAHGSELFSWLFLAFLFLALKVWSSTTPKQVSASPLWCGNLFVSKSDKNKDFSWRKCQSHEIRAASVSWEGWIFDSSYPERRLVWARWVGGVQ